MALGFTQHYKSGEQAFGTLTQSAYNQDVEAAGTVASAYPSIIVGHNATIFDKNINYDSCDLSSPVVIDYSQYANIAEGASSETAGSIASIGGCDFSGVSTTPSGGGSGAVASFSGGGCGSGGVSCASFTC